MSIHVDLNGELLPVEQAVVPMTDLSLLYGIGLFETMRAYAGRVCFFQKHIDRLLRSASELGLQITSEMLPDLSRLEALLRRNQLDDARVRIAVSGGAQVPQGVRHSVLTTAVPVEPYPEEYYRAGVTVAITAQIQATADPLAGHKTTCYWPRLQALHEARLKGCAEALWFNEKRQLTEGSISNVFAVRDGRVSTPPLDAPVLPGITRAAVLELCRQQQIASLETALMIDDLLDADEVFITNCMMEIVPVCRVERKAIAGEKVGAVTRQLMSAYRDRVSSAA